MHHGRPNTYRVTSKFLKTFGLNSLDDLPDLPKYKLDENEQIVLEDIINEKKEGSITKEDNIDKESNTKNLENKEERGDNIDEV